MASDLLGPTSTYSSCKDMNYVDHLYVNHSLDVEPQYENSEIIRKILQKSNGFSKSLLSIHDEVYNNKEENIYENVGFIENAINATNNARKIEKVPVCTHQNSQKDSVSDFKTIINEDDKWKTSDINENRFTSTLFLTITKPSHAETKECLETNILSIDVDNTIKESEADDSDDNSFKSSYAKSLIDSFHKGNGNQTSPISDSQSRLSSPMTTEENKPFTTLPQFRCATSGDSIINLETSQPFLIEAPVSKLSQNSPLKVNNHVDSKGLEHLEKKITSLTDMMFMKDKEMEKLWKEVSILKLECSRVKAENENLRMGLGKGLYQRMSSPFLFNGESHPTSLSSISSDFDSWTLQHQMVVLNAQLEKAEISRRAYEDTTRQLGHFLQNLNKTSSTAVSPDRNVSLLTPHNTSESHTNVELSFLHNRDRSDKPISSHLIREKHFPGVSKDASPIDSRRDVFSSCSLPESEILTINGRTTESSEGKLSDQCPLSSHNYKQSTPQNGTKASSSKAKCVSQVGASTMLEGKQNGGKRSNPHRRFSISNKAWNSTKKTLTRSGSVSNLPTETPSIPRVSRAVSTHCVAYNRMEPLNPHSSSIEGVMSETASVNPSNRMLSTKAKDLFSSLKNIFKMDSGDRNGTSFADATMNTKKKFTLPTIHRSSKLKGTGVEANTQMSTVSPTSVTLQKKRPSLLKTHTMPRVAVSQNSDLHSPHSNSVFYVSCATTDEAPVDSDLNDKGNEQHSPSLSEDGRLSSSNLSSLDVIISPVVEEELSAVPQELSCDISLKDSHLDNDPAKVYTPSPIPVAPEIVESDSSSLVVKCCEGKSRSLKEIDENCQDEQECISLIPC